VVDVGHADSGKGEIGLPPPDRLMTASPVDRSERIVAIDVLRGFALLGILGANITLFDVDGVDSVAASFDDLVVGAAGAPFLAFMLVVVLNKMMAVFSMLFGAGVLLVVGNLEKKGQSALGIHYVRNLLLVAIGLAHSWLWFGDILLVYGLCALLLYPLRRLPVSVLVGSAAAVWALAFIVVPGSDDEYVVRALAMMLAGMALYRTGVITGKRPTDWYRRWTVWSLGVGLTVSAAAWLVEDTGLAEDVNNLAVPLVAFGYVCLVMWVCGTGRLPRVQARLAAAGQMALTNYLLQTVLGIAVIGALNEVRGERVTAFWMMVAMLAIWALQLSWSVPWMRVYRFGPAEWLWRTATYRRVQPFRS
jgi:uncharacterized protein